MIDFASKRTTGWQRQTPVGVLLGGTGQPRVSTIARQPLAALLRNHQSGSNAHQHLNPVRCVVGPGSDAPFGVGDVQPC
jgi:hypothetical protein